MVFGGSFDPFHHGHGAVIRALLKHCQHVLIVPCGERTDKALSKPQLRLAMLEAGLKSLSISEVSVIDWEIKEGHIYTRTLMQRLRASYPHDTLYFVAGSDLIHDIQNSWVLGKELLQESNFAILSRKGYDVKELPKEFSKESFIMDLDLPELSSTFVKGEFKQGRPV